MSSSVSGLEAKVEGLGDTVNRIETKLDTWCSSMDSSVVKITEGLAEHKTHIALLLEEDKQRKEFVKERKKWVLGIIAGLILLIAGAFMKSHWGAGN